MKGFTLLEKLILIGVFGSMLLVMVLVLRWDARRTRDAQRLADVAVIANWLEVGFHDSLAYPRTVDRKPVAVGGPSQMQLCLNRESVLIWDNASQSCSGRVLISNVPRDPSHIGSALGNLCASQGRVCEYTYLSSEDGKDYNLLVSFEGPVGSVQCQKYPCIKTLSSEGFK